MARPSAARHRGGRVPIRAGEVVADAEATEHRSRFTGELGVSLVDALAGFVAGLAAALSPALVTIVFGMHSATQEILDVVTVPGGNAWTALRISVPGALTGALLAEWPATRDGIGIGIGIGSMIQTAYAQVQFSLVRSAVAIVTAVSLVLDDVAQIVETVVPTRTGMAPRRDG